jgi:hypothetical protein
MGTGAITQYIDVAQVAFYIFLLFFIGLVIYLTLESKREGFPLETERFGQVRREEGILGMPRPVSIKPNSVKHIPLLCLRRPRWSALRRTIAPLEWGAHAADRQSDAGRSRARLVCAACRSCRL